MLYIDIWNMWINYKCVSSSNQLFHLLKKTVLISKPVLWLPYRFSLQREFRQDCQNVKASQSWNDRPTKRFVELHPLTVIVNGGAEKKVAPFSLCAEHGHLYLVIVAVSALQFDAAIIDDKAVALLGGNSVNHRKIPVAVWVFELHKSLRW